MNKLQQKQKRKQRNRKKIKKNNDTPRLSVFKSNKYIYAQIINDEIGNTLASASSIKLKETGIEAAKKVGEEIANSAKKAKLTKVIFDRGSNKYHGKVKALAEAARENGLVF